MNPPDTTAIEAEVVTQQQTAERFAITDQLSYIRAGEALKEIKRVRKNLDELFDVPIRTALAAHRAVLAAKKRLDDPLELAEAQIKTKVAAWQVAEEAIRLAEQKRIEDEERKRLDAERKAAEEKRAAEAAKLASEGLEDFAESVRAAPTPTPPPPPVVIVPSTVPRVAGLSGRTTWSARVDNLLELVKAVAAGQQPLELITPNMNALNGMARSLKSALRIPGVSAVANNGIAVRSNP